MKQNYQDAMAIVGRFGVPDYFATITCNPGWKEIQDVLKQLSGSNYQDRADIVCRVFHAKFQAILKDMLKNGTLGHCIAYAYVIEFQKRGLPHAHCTFWMDPGSKVTTVDALDALIWAEIPDKKKYPRLYNIIKRSMIHGPCGPHHPTAACLKDGKCSKHYPKPFAETSILNPNGYSTYRRREDGNSFKTSSGFKITNQWVVPYNPYLTLKYNCHINLEICSGLEAIKYLYKYMYKGHDSANIVQRKEADGTTTAQVEYNEIDQWLNMRFISAMEATWRLLNFKMHELSHNIYRLNIHLPEQEPIVVQLPLDPVQIEAERKKRTKLKAWFELNRTDPSARKYLYTEIGLHYVWNVKKRMWTPRKRGADKIIPRMHNVSPRTDQLYFLRLLLLHVRGCQSFKDICTYKGVVWDNFKEACIARDLLQDDTEWNNCMTQAVHYQMPAQLRSLFVCINVCQVVQEPHKLLDKFHVPMEEDFARHSPDAAYHMMLNALSIAFAAHEKTMKELGLPEPDMAIVRAAEALLDRRHRIVDHFTPEQHAAAAEEHERLLNNDQRPIYETIMQDVESPHPRQPSKMHFINGQGGCGKTFLFMVS